MHKVKRKSTTVHQVTENEVNTSSDTDDLSCLELYNIKERDRTVTWLTPEVFGVKLKMELDTGSAFISVISAADYKQLFSKIPLQKTSVILRLIQVKKCPSKLQRDTNDKETRMTLTQIYKMQTLCFRKE